MSLYPTEAKITSRLSAAGLTEILTDPSATSTTALADAIQSATNTVDLYLADRYSTTDLAASEYVIDRATDIAVWQLYVQRGLTPPASVQARYDRAVAEFALIESGRSKVPFLTPTGRKNWLVSVPIHQYPRPVRVLPTWDEDWVVTDRTGEPS
jgi:phage gp36-like protein